ncbi:MAG TPA: AAA family ATPase, partial [Patescibacteria group bacterium]|nr:AAA family ATPase [Patescibacteria group bacterium]
GFDAAVTEADAILDALLSRIGDVTEGDPWLKLYVYGSPGAGKTTWTATAPNFLLYNVERGAKVLKGHKNLITGNSKALAYTSSFQAKQIVKYLREGHPAFDQYETFIVDSGSELQQKFNKELITEALKHDPTWDPTKMPDGGWNQSTQFMKDFFDDLRALDRHVIVTGHVKEETDQSTGRLLIRPNLTPKVTEAMAGIFDAVCYLERQEDAEGKEIRVLRVHPTTKPTSIMAKTRISGLEPLLVNSSFDTLLTAYNNQ